MPRLFGDPDPSERIAEGNGIASSKRRLGGETGSLSSRVQEAIKQLNSVIGGLDSALARFHKRDELLFGMMVTSVQERDNARATILANELAEVRKYTKMIMGSRLALEQMVLRLNTIGQLGDVVATLAPATLLIGSLRQGLNELMPEAEGRMGEISGLLNEILTLAAPGTNAGMQNQRDFIAPAGSEEAEILLSEAAALADSRIRKRDDLSAEQEEEPLPDVPVTQPESEMDMEPA